MVNTDIQEPLEEMTSCPATCLNPAACQGLANCTASHSPIALPESACRDKAAFKLSIVNPQSPVDKSLLPFPPGFGAASTLPATDEDEDEPQSKNFTSTRNACKLCTPLGACLAFRGVEGCIPFLHGSQGCSTYIRRYLISHFREPIDIASSNFHEESAIFGGSKNFTQGALNVTRQYQPQLIGAATTCLAETIGEDMARLQHELPYAVVPTAPATRRG